MALSVIGNNSTSTDRVLIVDEPIYYIGTRLGDLMDCIEVPKRCNEFRGGSKGKGGKTKYRRT